MKTLTYFVTTSLFTASVLSLTPVAQAAAYAPGAYTIDPMHSKFGFEIPHLVISTVEGRFNAFQGELVLGAPFSKSTAQAEAEVASIDTGVKDRDNHLKSPDFFDADKNPKLTFKSKRFEGKPENFKLVGDLTIKGVTREVTFTGKYLGAVKDAYGNEKVAFDASTKIDRKAFGLTWGKVVEAGPVVGDQVAIRLKLQATKAAPVATK